MADTGVCHVESVTGSGAAFTVVTRHGVVGSHRICRREWSRIVAVNTACQGVMELRGVHHREWSRIVTVNTACQGVMELRGVRRREWSRIVAVNMAC